jgi:hypothetical protein
MATIAENLKTIKDSTEAIKSAIIEKGGTIEGNLTTYASAIANLPSGGGDVNPTAEKNAVTFYDYDGTIRYSYTAEEFLALSEMPPLPTQKGLICQEWNWSHEDAVEYVTEYGILDVGASYITDDGKTRLYIRIAAEGRMDVPLYFQQTVANGVTIDWGDGSPTETLDGTGNVNTTHHYSSIGDYMISFDVADGCTLKLGHGVSDYNVMGAAGTEGTGGRVYCLMLNRVDIGSGITEISSYAFQYCYSLSQVIIPKGVTLISSFAFQYCYSLSSLIVPLGVSRIGNNAFHSCYALSSLILPSSFTLFLDNSLHSCYSLSSVIIPSGCSVIGASIFRYCQTITSVIIPKSVTTISVYAFQGCYGMAFYDFSHHTKVPTLSGTNSFQYISSDCKIIVPDSLYDTWVAATNWSTYASYIIKKTDWDNL